MVGISCIHYMTYVDCFNPAETVGCLHVGGWNGAGMSDGTKAAERQARGSMVEWTAAKSSVSIHACN